MTYLRLSFSHQPHHVPHTREVCQPAKGQLQSAGAVVLVLWEGAVLERRSIEVNFGSNTWQNAI